MKDDTRRHSVCSWELAASTGLIAYGNTGNLSFTCQWAGGLWLVLCLLGIAVELKGESK